MADTVGDPNPKRPNLDLDGMITRYQEGIREIKLKSGTAIANLEAGIMTARRIRGDDLSVPLEQVDGTPEPRGMEELSRAHDIMVSIVTGDVEVPLCDHDRRRMSDQLDVLCWALNHVHNPYFAQNLANLSNYLTENGIEFVPMTPEETRESGEQEHEQEDAEDAEQAREQSDSSL